jgi:hypothetical protein
MKRYKTYYDSEFDTWVIDNSTIKKGEFDDNPDVVIYQKNNKMNKKIKDLYRELCDKIHKPYLWNMNVDEICDYIDENYEVFRK